MILAKDKGCFVSIVTKIEITKGYLTEMKHSLEESHIINTDSRSDGSSLPPVERGWSFHLSHK